MTERFIDRLQEEDPNADLDIEKAMLRQAISEVFSQAMVDLELSRATLGERLNKSSADITQLLRGNRNMTLDTIATLAYGLGFRVRIEFEPLSAAGGSVTPVHGSVRSDQGWRAPAPSARKRAGTG